jgi:hypothetical protein
VKFMVTGGVLLAAVSLDPLGRQRRQAAGTSCCWPSPGR